ncbi:MAG TPA: hypothetical protein VIT20_05625 [Propionibacteriaceae bacterium]
MTVDPRDTAFVATLERVRPTLEGTAYLMLDDAASADSALDAILARLYGREVPADALELEALRALVSDDEDAAPLPWSAAPRFELVDQSVVVDRPLIVSDLSRLPRDQRAAIVLERFTELPSVQIADLLGRPVDEVLVLTRQARAFLAAGHQERQLDESLAAELRAAVPFGSGGHRATDDLAHGQRLIRRRRTRRGAAAVAAAVALIVIVSQLWPQAAPVEEASSPASSTSSPQSQPSCDTTTEPCRATIMKDWRNEMATVTSSHIDPERKYFSGYSFSYDDRYETPGIWIGQGGALALDMFRMDRGATEVYVQIATSRKFAVRCGATTGTTCVSMRFMDGNRFIMSESTTVKGGLEVQYSPDGNQVITAIARNTTQGDELHLERYDLQDLVQDPRLRLPAV